MSELDFAAGLNLALDHMLEREASGLPATVLIDGRAGSGKTSFAQALLNRFFEENKFQPKLIQMEDLYPGWDGLQQGSSYLLERILIPLSANQQAHWQVWNWETGTRGRDEVGNGMRSLVPGSPLIVEGCGSLSAATASLATLRVWIDAEDLERRSRFSTRDQGRFDDYFGIWAAQEDDFYKEHKSPELADFRIRN